MAIIKSIDLFFQEGTSDKVYNARVVAEPNGTFSVKVEWGRRGSKLNEGNKAVNVSRAHADTVFDRVVREKTNKGYQEATAAVQPAAVAPPVGQGSAATAPAAKKKVGRAAQLLLSLEDHELDGMLDDDDMLAQQKIDGIRVLAHVDGGNVTVTNRNGHATDKVPTPIVDALAGLPDGTVVDGEVVGDAYWMFDALTMGTTDIAHVGYEERWQILVDELFPEVKAGVHVLKIAVGRSDKRRLFEQLVDNASEGIVFKTRAAPYTAGRSAAQRKYKLQKSADVVITQNAGNAYAMGVHHHGKLVDVGKVFAGTTNASRAEIDGLLAAGKRPVAEVRYLYATDDHQLYQPVFVRLRDDKPARLCMRGQLKRTNKAVLP